MPREYPRTTEFGILLTKLRKGQKYSLAKLGSLAGVTAGYISLLERGKRVPGPKIIRNLSGPLDVQPTVLFVSASINTFDFASTLRDDQNNLDESPGEYKFFLSTSERIQVQIFIDFLQYKAAFDKLGAST